MTRSTGLSGFFKKVFSIFLLLYLLFTAAAFSLAAEKPVTKRILVLFSYHEGLPWERLIDDSLRATLASKSTEPIELNIEHTDRVSYPDDAYLHKLVNLYRHKYSHPKIDLVIGVDDKATEILLRHGEELFPETPMVWEKLQYYCFYSHQRHTRRVSREVAAWILAPRSESRTSFGGMTGEVT